MKILMIASLAVLLAGQPPASYAQEKTDNEVLVLLAKAKQQEQKIARGRLKVRSQTEHMAVPSADEIARLKAAYIEPGTDNEEAAKTLREITEVLYPQKKLSPHSLTIAFDSAKKQYSELRGTERGTYRSTKTPGQFIHAESNVHLTEEGNTETRTKYVISSQKWPLTVAHPPQSLWMMRGWESLASMDWTTGFRLVERSEDGTVVLMSSNKSTDPEKATDIKVWMDTKQGYTLTRVHYIFRKTGRVWMSMDCTYERGTEDTYYPKAVIETYFHEDSKGKWVPASRTHSQVDKVELNVPISQSELEIDIPLGSRIEDNRTNPPSVYRYGDKPPTTRGQRD